MSFQREKHTVVELYSCEEDSSESGPATSEVKRRRDG